MLDSNFFDEEKKLHPNIRRNLLNLKNDIVQQLLEKDFFFEPRFIIFAGSLTGANWDEYSDIDFHLGIDYSEYDDPVLAKDFLDAFAKNFNEKDYRISDRKVELYFQDIHEYFTSPGIYDIQNDHWIVPPKDIKIDIPEQVEKAADRYLAEVEALEKEYEEVLSSDGFFKIRKFRKKLQDWFTKVKEMRIQSIKHEGMTGFGNLVFKQLRRNGTFDKYSALRDKVERDLLQSNEV